ncbi:hypothetical protein [Streptomyces sp. NBC_01497]|uniref:hypothetical protein n=1 Tax=Streptomyces sp. NBC_01497 TaxID=2903885 RepID=UPI002E2F0E33|nr:hypothetical protein [Streptomyces sp. NBC_01497]
MRDQQPDPTGLSTSATAPPHRTSTVERGAFCTAQCSCGWRGPARRSRDLARSDARTHETGP